MRLKELRKAAGLNQRELADQLGFKQTTISQWEIGRRMIDVETLERLADFFGVTTDYILDRPEMPGVNTDPLDNKLLSVFNSLNDFGKMEVIKRINEMTQLTQYANNKQMPIAAHNDEQLTGQELELMQQDIDDL